MVVSGKADKRLLESYERERKPIAEQNTALSLQNYEKRYAIYELILCIYINVHVKIVISKHICYTYDIYIYRYVFIFIYMHVFMYSIHISQFFT
jgi:hypothetical protein